MLELTGRYAEGWWPTGSDGPEEYAAKLAVVRRAAERAKRDPIGIVPAKMIVCLLGERDEIREMLRQPLVKAYALQLTAESLRVRGYRHPMGDHWRGIQDIEPDKLTRERLLAFLESVDVEAILASVPHGTPSEVAREIKALYDAGLRVATLLDYSGMAGLKFGATSAAKVREAEDEALRLINGAS
jgi:phthiodiolone/phenolphthiodiolone dimycocerosates ketoreductase